MTDLSQALATVERTPEQANVLSLLERSKPEIARALPPGVDFERFTRVVLTEIRRVPKLLDCDPYSFMGAVMWAAQLNLEPGPLQHVHLIPFGKEVTFVVGYRGYIELAYRSGQVKDVYAELVHEGDVFRVVKGTSAKIVHEPAGAAGERETVAAYAVAHLKAGGTVQRVIYEEDWERARKSSAAGSKGKGPWADDRPAMIRKTALRRLESLLPKQASFGEAVMLDEQPAVWEPAAEVAAATPDEGANDGE